jgi:membrane fusion protein, copper/silver efflux system
MLNKTSKLVLAFFVTIMLATGLSFAQDQDSKDHKHSGDKNSMSSSTEMDSTKMDMSKDHMNMDHDKMMKNDSKGMMKDKSSIVREGVIDLSAIDKNGDGKVFQDVMDWNVISDEPGMCPACGMKLKEVTLEEAKANLEKNGFKVK